MLRKVISGAVFTTIALVGVINVIDYIYSATSVSASTSGLNMSATINPSSTINLSASNVSLDITPSAAGTLGKSSALVLSTYTNTNYDCTVTMTADSASLVSGVNTIPSLASGSTYTDATFTNDSWGFQIENGTNYRPVLAGEGANSIKTISSATGGTANTTNIYFAAKLTQATKPGTYTNTVTFASTCVPPKTYMQNISASTLATLMPNVGDEVTMYDSRDEKSYTVAKLADGNYWMTQNLDHDIVAQANYYTPQNTDIPSAWTPSTATYATGTTTWATGTTGRTTPQSYDPGDLCWDGTITEDWTSTLDNETTTCGSDKHMHIGNYYNWTAAVAMNNSSSYTADNTDVNQSICPAGWMLPKSGTIQTGSKSFQYLWNQYSSSFDENTIMNSPLYFSYAGTWNGSSENVGSYGNYWSSVVSSSSVANGFDFEIGLSIRPQGIGARDYGCSVRCVAR